MNYVAKGKKLKKPDLALRKGMFTGGFGSSFNAVQKPDSFRALKGIFWVNFLSYCSLYHSQIQP